MIPSARSLAAAAAIVAVALIGWVVARSTGVFAVTTIDVEGAPPAVAVQVKRALRDDLGTSLLRLDMARVRERIAAVPTVAKASFDRAFPHTLRVTVVPELPVAVVRQGSTSWLVSARGRVMASLQRGARKALPRIWVQKSVPLTVGDTAPGSLDRELAAVAPLRLTPLKARVTSVRTASDELTLILRSGREVRLGDPTDVRLKLVVAAKVLPLVASDTRYVDVSVPERPVAGSIVERPDTTSPTETSATTGVSTTTNGNAATSTSGSGTTATTAGATGPSGATGTTGTTGVTGAVGATGAVGPTGATSTQTGGTDSSTLKSQLEVDGTGVVGR